MHLDWVKEAVDFLGSSIQFPPLNLYQHNVDEGTELMEIEEIALKAREYYNLGRAPIDNMVQFVGSKGVMVSSFPFESAKVDGFSQWDPVLDMPFIALNTDLDCANRRRYDITHELGHLILHREIDSKRMESDADFYNKIESQAHWFAAAFLIPKPVYFSEIPRPTFPAFLAAKEKWKASIKMLIKRARDLGDLSASYYQRMLINYNRKGWSKGEPLEELITYESPVFLQRCFDLLWREGLLDHNQFKDAFPYPRRRVEKVFGITDGFLDEDILQPIFRKKNVVAFPKRG